MEREHARMALDLCDQMRKLHEALCELFFDDFLDLFDAEYEDPDFDDPQDDSF